jgi:hypothetical protein
MGMDNVKSPVRDLMELDEYTSILPGQVLKQSG